MHACTYNVCGYDHRQVVPISLKEPPKSALKPIKGCFWDNWDTQPDTLSFYAQLRKWGLKLRKKELIARRLFIFVRTQWVTQILYGCRTEIFCYHCSWYACMSCVIWFCVTAIAVMHGRRFCLHTWTSRILTGKLSKTCFAVFHHFKHYRFSYKKKFWNPSSSRVWLTKSKNVLRYAWHYLVTLDPNPNTNPTGYRHLDQFVPVDAERSLCGQDGWMARPDNVCAH